MGMVDVGSESGPTVASSSKRSFALNFRATTVDRHIAAGDVKIPQWHQRPKSCRIAERPHPTGSSSALCGAQHKADKRPLSAFRFSSPWSECITTALRQNRLTRSPRGYTAPSTCVGTMRCGMIVGATESSNARKLPYHRAMVRSLPCRYGTGQRKACSEQPTRRLEGWQEATARAYASLSWLWRAVSSLTTTSISRITLRTSTGLSLPAKRPVSAMPGVSLPLL